MAISRFKQFFSDNKPFYLLIILGSASAAIWNGTRLFPTSTPGFWYCLNLIVVVIVSALLGAILTAVFGGMALGMLLLPLIEKSNGAPFKPGDRVIIISRRYRGQLTTVYEVWPSRHQVRVDLGDEAKRTVTDVFEFTDICRTPH